MRADRGQDQNCTQTESGEVVQQGELLQFVQMGKSGGKGVKMIPCAHTREET